MTRSVLLIIIGILGIACTINGQSQGRTQSPQVATQDSLAGAWTYRSYRNQPDVLIGTDAQKALAGIFGEGVMTVEISSTKVVTGTFDMGDGYVLDLEGHVIPGRGTSPRTVTMTGKGRQGTQTENWQYDYIGYVAPSWPKGIDQVPAIVGTVIRTNPHGNAQAGYVASFVATKQ